MDISQWIGFFISILAFLYLLTKKDRRQQQPNGASAEEEHRRKILRALNIQEEEEDEEEEEIEELLPPPPRPLRVQFATAKPKQTVLLHENKVVKTHATRIIKELRSPRDAILLREILGPPKASQPINPHQFWD